LFAAEGMGYVPNMKFAESDDSGGYLVEGYGSDGIRIQGRSYRTGLILTPDRIIEGWGPEDASRLTIEHVAALLELEPQVIVIGTGRAQVFPDPSVYSAVARGRVGLELMDSGAACRTYNILMSEGRRVVAGLMPY
jgi:uncharacterized protein